MYIKSTHVSLEETLKKEESIDLLAPKRTRKFYTNK